ncbi:MAG TPA: DUF1176 domain-containing protein [Afifellaceae bacterium]|nr:DUF1176 domain-containing protein [Afifellaceae bacterium]
MIRQLLFCAALLASIQAARASDSWSETFRDWQATCFPHGGCETSTGDRGASASGDTLRLIVERTSAEAPGWFVAVEFHQKPTRADRAITLSVPAELEAVLAGGQGFRAYRGPERFYVTDPQTLNHLLPALLAGDEVGIGYFDVTNEARSYTLSLSGITASVLWIEEQMKMVGAPRRSVMPVGLPAAGPPPVDPVREAGIPEAVRAYHDRTSDCEIYDDDRLEELGSVIEPLDKTSILYVLPCTAHAYNVTYRLYLRQIGEIGGIRTLHFAEYTAETNWTGTDLLYNVTVEGQRLAAFYKGRGTGDCGVWGQWTWQGYSYRLDRYAAQPECNGARPQNWPVVFPPQ